MLSTKRISKDSGADVDIIGDSETPQTLIDRIITIQGGPDHKEAACTEVVRITHDCQDVRENEEGIFVLVVPVSATSFIVGLNGTTISGLIEATGTDVSISRHTIQGTRLQPISISGTLVATVAAAGRINALLQQLADTGSLEWDAWPRFQRGRAAARSARTSRDSPPGSRTRSMHVVSAKSGFSGTATTTTAASTAASTRNSSRSATPARAAGSSASGYACSSSSSLAPAARGGEASGEARSISAGRSVGGGSASSTSTSRVPADLPISARESGGHSGTWPRPSSEHVQMISPSVGNAKELAAAAAFACMDARRQPPVLEPAIAGLTGDAAPNEAALLKLLLGGPDPNRAQLQLALPSDFVQGILEKHLRTFEARSGSKLELGPEHLGSGAEPATCLLTTTGSMLSNSMAILYIQELMNQHSGEFGMLGKP